MVSSVKENSSFISAVPDDLFEIESQDIATDGGSVTFVLYNGSLKELVSDADKNDLVAYGLSLVFEIEQDIAYPGVLGEDYVAAAIARLGQWTVDIKCPRTSERFFAKDGSNSVGCIIQTTREIINTPVCLHAEDLIGRNGVPKYVGNRIVANFPAGMGYGDQFTNNGQDPAGGFGSQCWQMLNVSTGAATTRFALAAKSAMARSDVFAIPTCRSASRDVAPDGTYPAGEGEPLKAMCDTTTGWTITVTRKDFTEMFSAGTVFASAKVRISALVRYYRKGADARALGAGYYVQAAPSAAPFLVPQDWRPIAVYSGPAYADKTLFATPGGQTLAPGYVPQNYFTSFGPGAKLYWTESRNGTDTIVAPVSRQNQHPLSIIRSFINCGSDTWKRGESRWSRMPLDIPRVDRGAQPWQTAASTRISFIAYSASSVPPTNVGLDNSIIGDMTHPVSGLWRMPLVEIQPAMKGMPGGPFNGGDLAKCNAVATFQLMPCFNPGQQLTVIRDAGSTDASLPQGFKQATMQDALSACGGCPAETGAAPAPDGKSIRNAAIVATGYVINAIPNSGTAGDKPSLAMASGKNS